jgi:predicted alpha/beta superfamily hydrolase
MSGLSRLRGARAVGTIAVFLAALAWSAVIAAGDTGLTPVMTGTEVWVPSTVFHEQRRIQISLPSDYGVTQGHYPVLYVLDGDAYFTYVAGLVRLMSESSGRIPEMIVVSIPNVARERELAPPLQHPTTANEIYTADVFHRFLQEDLLPWVEGHYRTEPFRLLIGHSRGGLFAFYSLLNWPETFDAYLALSPAIWWDDERWVREAPARLRALQAGPHARFLYLSAGHESKQITGPAGRVARILRQAPPAGLRWRYDYLPRENHMSSYVPSAYEGLQMVFADLQVPEAVILAKGLTGVDAHYARLASEYGFPIQPSSAMLSWMGSFLEQQERPKQAATFFQRAAARFPQQPKLLRDWETQPLP